MKTKLQLQQENRSLKRLLKIATDNVSCNWKAWIHEQDCPGYESDQDCRCDGEYIIEEVEKVLAARKKHGMGNSR